MKWFKLELKQVHTVRGIECDRCRAIYANMGNEVFEYQEFLHIYIDGGYQSVFGDGARLECDLCQRCAKELLGQYLRESPEENAMQ